MSRVRVYDSEDIAQNMYETFTAREVKRRHKFSFNWPVVWQHVGDSLAIAYSSDKWRDKNDLEIYKHLAESRNRAFCTPDFLRDFDNPNESWSVIGPMVSFADVVMPDKFAILCIFEEIDLQLHTRGTDDRPRLGRGNEGIVKVTVGHGMLGGGQMQSGELFLFVYTDRDGPLVLVVGEELDILPDGIVG